MRRYLIFGTPGLVGSRFADLVAQNRQPIAPEVHEVDICQKNEVFSFFQENRDEFEVVVNFAAITDVDGAEKERGKKKSLVYRVNAEGAVHVAQAAQKYGKFLIHISTDFIFPGSQEFPGPYSEKTQLPERPDGISWYGWTKLMGEKMIQEVTQDAAIARISYPFRAHHPAKLDFARKILMLFDEGKLYPMFSDQIITPTFIDEAAQALGKIADKKNPGIYHLASSNATTPYDFASYLLEKARGVRGVVKKGSLREFLKTPSRTPRPIYGGLETKGTEKKLAMKFLTWQQAIDEFVHQLKNK